MGVVAGTAGHVDHGKSSLMRWLTGVDPDRLVEEKLRGITIELGYVFMPLPDDRVLAFIDVPGHEKFIRQMVAGVATVDFFLLVVAADEGVMQQTREHLEILRLLGVGRGLVALTKCDLVDQDIQDLAEAEIEDLLVSNGYGGSRLVRVSSVTGSGMEDLRQALVEMAQEIERAGGDPRFRLSIDRVFTLQGHGSIVAGTVLSGSVSPGDSLELLPGGKVFRIREIRVNEGRTRGAGTVGDRVALNLVGLEREEAKRGSSLATPGWLEAADALDTEISMLPGFPLEVRQRVRFHCGTAEVMARAIPMEGKDIPPGSQGFVHFQLEEPVVFIPGDRFVVRRYSPVTTIGGGVILESKTSKVRARNRDDRLKRIGMLAGGDLEGFLLERLSARPVQGVLVSEVAREVGRSPMDLEEAAKRLVESGEALLLRDGSAGKLVLGSAFREASGLLMSSIASYHRDRPLSQGLPTGAVGRLLPDHPQWFIKGLLSDLMDRGAVRRGGDRISASDHPVELPPDLQAVVDRLTREVESTGFNGYDCSSGDQVVFEAMLERGLFIDLEKGLVTTPGMAEKAWRVLEGSFDGREFRLGELREALGVPRRAAVLWAGVLDDLGYTVRHGELRRARTDG